MGTYNVKKISLFCQLSSTCNKESDQLSHTYDLSTGQDPLINIDSAINILYSQSDAINHSKINSLKNCKAYRNKLTSIMRNKLLYETIRIKLKWETKCGQ